MKGKIKQFCLRMAMVMVLAVAIPFQSFAASARISFSDPSAESGSEFSVRMKFTCTSGETLGNTDVMLAYDATALEFLGGSENASGGAGAIRVTSGMSGVSEVTTELKFRALKAGTTQITISSWEGYDADGQMLTMEREGTSTITISAGAGAAALSNDASMQSLQISPGVLEPAFSPDVESYTTSVGLSVEKLTVSALASSDAATVTVEGGSELAEGENTVTCRVTAQDGTTTRTYTILVNKVEGGAEDENPAPEESETADRSAEILVHLEDTKAPVKIGILAIPADAQIPGGLKESTITIGDVRVQGWTPEEGGQSPDYCIFYAVNEETGTEGFYRYDMAEKSLQRYFEYSLEGEAGAELIQVTEKYNSLVDDYNLMKWIAIGASAAAVILLLVLIAVIAGAGRKDKREPQERSKPEPKPERTSRGAGHRKLSREELYMMGEEDDYEEEDEAYEKQPGPADYLPQTAAALEETDSRSPEYEPFPEDAGKALRTAAVEQSLEEDLAREASSAADDFDDVDLEDDEDADDFEVFDLDSDDR